LKKVQLQNKAQEGKSVRCTPTLGTHLALSPIFRVVFSALRGRWACYGVSFVSDLLTFERTKKKKKKGVGKKEKEERT
jgi:hypothetical protein